MARSMPPQILKQKSDKEEGKSLLVAVVKPNGSAYEAGLRVGDLLVNWNGAPIPAAMRFATAICPNSF